MSCEILRYAMDWHLRYSQQARWTEEIRTYLFQRIGFSDCERLLEVGCGTGAVLETVPSLLHRPNTPPNQTMNTKIFGLDIDPTYLDAARVHAPSARLTLADARQIPFQSASFDLVFCHFLLLWVKPALKVLQEMRRVARPGGWVAAFAEPDYGGRIDYPEQLIELGCLQEESLRGQGAEPHLGRQLKALFHETGLMDIECGLLGAQWRTQPSRQEMELEWQVIAEDLRFSLDPARLEHFHRIEQDAWEKSIRTLFVPTFYAFGRVP